MERESLADAQGNTALANGDDNGEYWRITTPDGTRYYFGYNRPSGWVAGKPETNSAWTVPVYGNQAGEPCIRLWRASSSRHLFAVWTVGPKGQWSSTPGNDLPDGTTCPEAP